MSLLTLLVKFKILDKSTGTLNIRFFDEKEIENKLLNISNYEDKDEDLELDENGDIENIERSLKDEDFVEYNEFLEEESEKDISYLDSIAQGDDE